MFGICLFWSFHELWWGYGVCAAFFFASLGDIGRSGAAGSRVGVWLGCLFRSFQGLLVGFMVFVRLLLLL